MRGLKNTGYSRNKFNNIINQINDRMSCDTDCQQNLKAQKLKESWKKAIDNKKNAISNVNIAEKEYYLFTKGENEYDELVDERDKIVLKKKKEQLRKQHNKLSVEITNNIRYLANNIENEKRIKELFKLRKKKHDDLEGDIIHARDSAFTDNRRIVYQSKDTKHMITISKIIRLFYYLPIFIMVLGALLRKFNITTPYFVRNFATYDMLSFFSKIMILLYIFFPILLPAIVQIILRVSKKVIEIK